MAKKVLIVEDDVLVAELLKDNFETLPYKFFLAYDGKVGLDLARKERPDLIIMDIGLPSINGIALCKYIKDTASTKHAKVIMLTGKKMLGDIEDAFQAGADAYVNKPFDWSRMLAHIEKLMGPA